jgi:hemerythrin-like domain-containing protein
MGGVDTMKPIGPLMREHRTIERMLALMKQEQQYILQTLEVDEVFINATIDFFTTYVDMAHHGKEEGIQFKTLDTKNMTAELCDIMEELIQEHQMARDIVIDLGSSLHLYNKGNDEVARQVAGNLGRMIELYPMHIEKEDKHFFYPSLDYLTQEEQDTMLNAFWKFDQDIIQERYGKLIDDMKVRQAKFPALSQTPTG